MASYPSSLPSFVTPGANLSTPPHSAQHTAVNAEVVAICTTLGTNPQSTSATVAARLLSIEASIGTTGHSQNTDLGTTNSTFYIGGTAGPHLKANSSNLDLRNHADDDYVDLTVGSINVQNSITDGLSNVAVSDLISAVTNNHTHANKSTLDTYNQTNTDLTSAVTLKHTQNTDTGTTNETFQMNNGNVLSAKVKVDDAAPTIVEIRNGADSGYADLRAANFLGELTADNSDINRPMLRFNDTTDKWQLSNNGVSFVDIAAGATLSGLAGYVQFVNAAGDNLDSDIEFIYDSVLQQLSIPTLNITTGGIVNAAAYTGDGEILIYLDAADAFKIRNSDLSADYSQLGIGMNVVGGYAYIQCKKNASGTELPLTFWSNAAERMRISTAGVVRLNAYTTNGLVTFSGADGTLGVDTSTYATTAQALLLNQGTPQTVTGGAPIFSGGISYDNADWTGGNIIYVPLTKTGKTQTEILNEAITNATAGDTLILASGTYTITTSLLLTKSINVRGQGISATTITTTAAATSSVTISSGNVRVTDMTISNFGTGTSYGISTSRNLTSIVCKDLSLVIGTQGAGTAGVKACIYALGSSVSLFNTHCYPTSSDDSAFGLRIDNDSSVTINMTVNILGSMIQCIGGASANSRGIYLVNTNDTNTITNYVSNCLSVATGGGANTCGIEATSTTTNTITVNATTSTFSGTGYDVRVTNPNILNLTGCALQNGTTNIVTGGIINYLGQVEANSIQFNTSPTVGTFSEGKVYWDSTFNTVAIESGSGTSHEKTLQVGQEEWRMVTNNTGTDIQAGLLVYTVSSDSGLATIAKAQANTQSSSQVLGMTTEIIHTGSSGMVTVRGNVNDVNTERIDAAYLNSQGILYHSKAYGTAGNAFKVVVSAGGSLAYTEDATTITITLGGASATTADVVALFTATPSALCNVREITAGDVYALASQDLAGGVAITEGQVLYLSPFIDGVATTVQPTSPNYDIRIGRLMTKHATAGRINVRIIPAYSLDQLSDVSVPTATLDDILKFNGSQWVNAPAGSATVDVGINFYQDDTAILPHVAGENVNEVNTLSKTPITSTATQVDSITLTGSTTALGEAYLYNAALAKVIINAGTWNFSTYCRANTANRGSIQRYVYQVIPNGVGVTFTTSGGDGTSRTATISTGTPFIAGDASATLTTGGYFQTEVGLYKITAVAGDFKSCTLSVPSTYTNETNKTFKVWRNIFGIDTGTISNTTTGLYTLISNTSVQADKTIAATDMIGEIVFGTSTNNVTVYWTHNGTSTYSNFRTPLVLAHNDLAGLQGGSSTERYHLTSTEYTATASTGSGAMARLTSPAFTTPNIGTPSAGTLTSCTGLPITGLVAATGADKDKYLHANSGTGVVEWASTSVATGTRGTFENGDLSTGVLTITHSKALSAPYTLLVTIADNNQKQIIPDSVTFLTDTIAVDLTSYGVLTGTWGFYLI